MTTNDIVGTPGVSLIDPATASIDDYRLVIQDSALPAHADHARVIILWESNKPAEPRSSPPALAGMGTEKGDILSCPSESDWEVLS